MKRETLCLILLCLYLLSVLPIAAQTIQKQHLSEDSLKKGIYIREWKYHPGDNPDWADPEFDDTSWQMVDTRLLSAQSSRIDWQGTGWFRLHLVVDPELMDRPLGLFLRQSGISDIYLDGELIYQHAEPGAQQSRQIAKKSGPKPISFHGKLDHLIAVQYWISTPEDFYEPGFALYLGELDQMVRRYTDDIASDRSVQGIFSALPLAFGLLHLLLFLFFRRAVGNLYFAISMFVIAAATFLDYQSTLAIYGEQEQFYLRIHRGALALLIISVLRFMYSLFHKKLPPQFWILSAATIVTGILAVYKPSKNLFYLNLVFILVIVEMVRVNILAVYRKTDGAWIILVGFILQIVFAFYDVFLDFKVLVPVYGIENAYFIGTFGLIVCMSVYLARDFAKTRRNLEIYSAELKESNARLEEYSHTLEERVAERTRSLAERNEELQTTLRKLTETQAQLIQSGKMASLGSLVAGVAHEMNNPVGVIVSAADIARRGIHRIGDLLQDKSDRSEEQLKQSLELVETNHSVITTAGDRIAGIVQSLRSFATLDEALFQQVDLHKNIDITLTLIQHELRDKATVIKEYGYVPRIQCYPNELNQAFMNLLRNAAQAIEGQGTVTIATYTDEARVYVRISDTGKGIPPEDLPRIYDPGFTTQSGGVGKGLGLSIVYNIIQKHHGNIQVNSKVGKGTQVIIALPVEQTRV